MIDIYTSFKKSQIKKRSGSFFDKKDMRYTQKGSAIFYIFLAVGLLAAISFAVLSGSRTNQTTQSSARIVEDLFSQANLIRSAIIECTVNYPGGGGDLNGDNVINTTDNANIPFPVRPNDPLNPYLETTDTVLDLTCTGAPTAAEAVMFTGAGTRGRFLPPMSSGFSDWTYENDALGVRIETVGPNAAATVDALVRLDARFAPCEADINYASCGATCFTVWLIRASCP